MEIRVFFAKNIPLYHSSGQSSQGKINGSYSGLRFALKLSGKEIFRSEPAVSSIPTWNASFTLTGTMLTTQMKENCRPSYLEYVDIDILEYSRGPNHGERIFEGRIPLIITKEPQDFKLLKVFNSLKDSDDVSIIENISEAKVSVDVTIPEHVDETMFHIYTQDFQDSKRLQLCQVLSLHLPQFQHIYIGFDDWTYGAMIGCHVLPGPRCGEIVLDKHDAEWSAIVGVNAFGDRTTVQCRGTLFLTDLRLIFIPNEVIGPIWLENILTSEHKINGNLTQDQILLVRRLSIQIPISAIQDSRCMFENIHAATIMFDLREGSSLEFKIRRMPIRLRSESNSSSSGLSPNHRSSSKQLSSTSTEHTTIIDKTRQTSQLFRSGLDTEDVTPNVWCNRVIDEINWRQRSDSIWILWLRYLKETIDKHYPPNEISWLRSVRQIIDFEAEFQRLRIQDSDWVLSDVNRNYGLCPTYPQTMVVPGILSEKEIYECATHRSRGRIASLVWLHPITKASLCRSSQPMSGMSGASNEADRKYCIALKTSCPRGLPLRIADARPRLNANANAIQGKGFENIAFLGGSKNASLVFLDIENIHIMRSSFLKLKEGLLLAGLGGSGSESNIDVIAISKWNFHISQLLRGALGIAESITIGHPILLHCSDGWDRTAQLSALTQILLDPYYRTVHGFFVLINKDFCAYGHRFESRLGKLVSNSKESSPIFHQFLDAVHQLLIQFPTHFEFTSYFLLILLQCAYSGYFITFRGDCERERYLYVKQTSSMENLTNQDTEYSSVYCYIGILLRCPQYARLMINPYFNSGSNGSNGISGQMNPMNNGFSTNLTATGIEMSSSGLSISSITNSRGSAAAYDISSFIRPKYSINDMIVWREGIFGYCPDVASFYGKYSLTLHENQSIQSNSFLRSMNYFQSHSNYLDNHLINRYETVLHYDNYITSMTTSIPYQQPWEPITLSFRKQYAKLAVTTNHKNDSTLNKKYLLTGVKILIWYRAEKLLRSAWKTIESTFPNQNLRMLMKRIYRSLLQSEQRLKLKLRWMSYRMTNNIIRSILDDVIEDTVNRCIRSEMMISPYDAFNATYSQLQSNPSQTQSNIMEAQSNIIGAAKTISNKFRTWTGGSSNSTNNSSAPMMISYPILTSNGHSNTTSQDYRSTSPMVPSSNKQLVSDMKHEGSKSTGHIPNDVNGLRLGTTRQRDAQNISPIRFNEEESEQEPLPFDPLSDLLTESVDGRNVKINKKSISNDKLN